MNFNVKKIIYFMLFFFYINAGFANADSKITFKEFVNNNKFVPIKKNLLELTSSECNSIKNKNKEISYKEIILYSEKNEILHLNKHFEFLNDYQSLNNSIPFHSISLWSWYQTVAIKTKNFKFFSNFKQITKRRNMIVPNNLILDIIKFGEFDIYLHQDKNTYNQKYYGSFKIKKTNSLKSCFNPN